MDLSKLTWSSDEWAKISSFKDSLKSKKHVLSRVETMYTTDFKAALVAAGPIATMGDSAKAALLGQYQTYKSTIEDLMAKIQQESIAIVNMILSIEDSNDPEVVNALIKSFNEGVQVYTDKGVAVLGVLAADSAPLKTSIPTASPTVVASVSGPSLPTSPEPKFVNMPGYPAPLSMECTPRELKSWFT